MARYWRDVGGHVHGSGGRRPDLSIVELTWKARHRQLYGLRGDSAHIPDHACWEVVTSVFLGPCCQMPIALLGGRAGWLVNRA